MTLALIVAIAKNGVIGKQNTLPWNIPEDLALFKKTTIDSVVIMGKHTFESIGRPLPKRITIVVSSTLKPRSDLHIVQTLSQAIELAKTFQKPIFIIGGKRIYEESLNIVDTMYISHIKKAYEGDTYFPTIDFSKWQKKAEEEFDAFTFTTYVRKQ